MEVNTNEQTYSIIREINYEPAFGIAMGSSTVIDQGAVLTNFGVINSATGQPEIVIIDTLDNIIAEYRIDDNFVVSYQALCRDLSYISRPSVMYVDIDDACHILAGGGHSEYLWSDSDTNRLRSVDGLAGDSLFVMGKFGVGWVCSSFIDVNECNLITGVDTDFTDSRLLSVFPNPVKEHINISKEGNVMIYDSQAKLVYANSNVGQNRISVVDLPSGLYHLILFSSSGTYHTKFVKN